MRDEMLKKLDELLKDDGASRNGMGPGEWRGLREEWFELREELVAERCENCAHWRFADVGSAALCMKPGSYLYLAATVFHYYCPHFEKKES